MDYSDRVNSKKGAGGVADRQEANIHTRRRIQELISSQVLDLENDPYVFRNHLGMLECRLCLTTHTNEASYISHLGGRKHTMNLQKRRMLDERSKGGNNGVKGGVLVTTVEKRRWKPIGVPEFSVKKIRHPELLRRGVLVQIRFPKAVVEPVFRVMSFYELSPQKQTPLRGFLGTDEEENIENSHCLVVSAEPYTNIALALPPGEIDAPKAPETMSELYWWLWDTDSREFFVQVLMKL